MMSQFYFSIRYLPEQADNELLAGRCISTMHGFISNDRNSQFKNSVGVSFPRWDEHSVGNVIAFVSTNTDLLVGLSFQPYFSTMVGEGVFDISSVEPVPGDVDEVRFVRNQTIAKSFIGSKKRRINRGMRRAEVIGQDYFPESEEEREFDFFHSVPMNSSSTDEFVLFIQREVFTEEKQEGFNSYGLATNDKWRGTVPDFVL
ncbi:type I-F CRISPR-associated endoribonuclease Cas6/Csy4 [Vibrio aestuarianus]|uniref:type I-F CRISPR-associated endoribonuclease Cas6/Csy4 n=1 Tax=Vibrio aestuarianus TaxID=28171 RepID=UPI00237CB4DA|nr:type I-F CRISPR-associated endoribonuclease Cas6/Csy4 [Vibrio aestuarianus]MDE1264559.1 type I-F CRISPR-associated endoribonuclease Cas6/Csy4 [Vibrio aestuarianus]MDE1296624.1 type I-F CRISPR-associated endoribonuclease Cas6/Csy4 [Vibrio aestuarianus]